MIPYIALIKIPVLRAILMMPRSPGKIAKRKK